MSKTNPSCPDDLICEKHFLNFYFLSLLLDYEQTFFRNSTESLRAGLPKLPSTVWEILKEENISHQKKIFPSVSDLSWWFTGLGMKLRSVIKAAFEVSGGTFYPKSVLEKNFNTFAFSATKFSLFRWEIVDLIVRPSFYVFTRTFWGKKIRRKGLFQFFFFDFGKEIFKLLAKNSQQSCQNSTLRIQRMNPRHENVFEVQNSPFFHEFEQIFSDCKR